MNTLHVFIMSRTCFRVNPHSIVTWMSSKEFLDNQVTIEFRFTLKHVHDMIKTYNQLHRTGKYSQHRSIILSVWLNGWAFVYERSGSGYESPCSHLNFRYRACFERGVPWYSGNYRAWIHSETWMWNNKNIQTNAPCRYVLTIQLNH